jgi:hypothetical protein
LLSRSPLEQIRAALTDQGRSGGLCLELGPYVARIRTRIPEVVQAVATLYRHHRVASGAAFVDFDVAIRRPVGRAIWKPQVVFEFDGNEPFNPLPGDQGLPLLEWGLNWCVYGLGHQHLTLHAAVLERDGRALVLPAPSGSGKSTLCAALLFSGWRLLSDELTLIDPARREILPLPRPVSLKNASIDVIKRFAPQVEFGSMVHETAKGVVAHFPPPAAAVEASGRRATPAWIVFPKFVAGVPARFTPMERARAFMQLIENAFNYDVFGNEGFDLLGDVVDRCRSYTFEYGDLAEAVARFDRLASGADV